MRLGDKITGLAQLRHFDNRWQLVWSHLTGAPDRIDIYRSGPVRLAVDRAAGDACAAREVFATPMYRWWLEQMDLTAPLTVLDLGAHIGSFTLLLRSMRCDLSRVVCVEMNPNTFIRLQSNISSNLSTGYSLKHAAICDRPGHVELTLGSGDAGDSIESGQGRPGSAKRYRIETTTFDALVESEFGPAPIDVCKIDIEGTEYDVLGSPTGTTLSRCRYLIIEIHDRPGHSAIEARAAIERAGFAPLGHRPGDPEAVVAFRNQRLTPPGPAGPRAARRPAP